MSALLLVASRLGVDAAECNILASAVSPSAEYFRFLLDRMCLCPEIPPNILVITSNVGHILSAQTKGPPPSSHFTQTPHANNLSFALSKPRSPIGKRWLQIGQDLRTTQQRCPTQRVLCSWERRVVRGQVNHAETGFKCVYWWGFLHFFLSRRLQGP